MSNDYDKIGSGVAVTQMTYGPHGGPIGLAREWHPSGELRRERRFPDDGGSAFSDVTYYRNGQVKYRRVCPRHSATGLDEKFHPDGSVRMEGRWHGGRKVDVWRWFFSNGQQRLEVPYVDGVIHGTIRAWRKAGESILVGEVQNGRPIGDWFQHLADYDELRQPTSPYPRYDFGLSIYDRLRRPIAELPLVYPWDRPDL